MKSVSAIIINYNGGTDVRACVESLQLQPEVTEVTIVDNASTDGSTDFVVQRQGLRLVEMQRNLGFAGGANAGAQMSTGDVLLFLNPDIVLELHCVERLLEALIQGAGVAGPVLDVEASQQREFGAVIDNLGYPVPLTEPGAPLYVPGCALATPKEMFNQLGGFDDRFFLFVEDVDYCWRVLLSGVDVQVPLGAQARHLGGGSTPGGYGGRTVRKRPTTLRLVQRERNSLAMIIKNSSRLRLAPSVVVFILQSLMTALGASLLGNPSAGIGILKGLAWNLTDIRETLNRRRLVKRISDGEKKAASRIVGGSNKLNVLLRHGLPKFVDTRSK